MSEVNAEAYTGTLEGHILPRRQLLFLKGESGYFKRTIPGLILHMLQWLGFTDTECVCFAGLTAVYICLLLKMCGES